MVNADSFRSRLDRGDFEPFIRHIRFPLFRNLNPGTCVEFTFPITALVGPNGTTKTSILRALQGCPDYQNLGNVWFSTKLDRITAQTRHRFIHGYRVPSGDVVEALKTRIEKARNPDYFEPSRPIVGDGMIAMPLPSKTPAQDQPYRTSTRWKAIQKRVLYLDFRRNIPAYDMYYHLDIVGRLNDVRSKKAFLRRRAGHLAETLQLKRKTHLFYRRESILEPASSLTDEERAWVNRILGRDFSEITVVKHGYYLFEGTSVLLKSHDLAYSEAFAGSGEYAVVMIVRSVLKAEPKALVLLDEPEVSLHPGAQLELMRFLESAVASKRHQVVMSTHSPEIIRSLPAEAIKVLTRDAMTGLVSLPDQSTPQDEAFRRLGVATQKRTIFVEDTLAQRYVERAIKVCLPGSYFSSVEVKPLGSSSQMLTKHVPSLVHLGESCLMFLDGDQRPNEAIRDHVDIADSEVLGVLAGIGISKRNLNLDGGDAGNEAQGLARAREILQWVRSNVRYLPGNSSPEDDLMRASGGRHSEPKKYWAERTSKELGMVDGEQPTSQQIGVIQQQQLAKLEESDLPFGEIAAVVRDYVDGAVGG